MYFIFTNDDGDPSLKPLTRNELLKNLNQKYYGNVEFRTLEWLIANSVEYLNGAILIKGEIVVPHAKETVTEFDVP